MFTLQSVNLWQQASVIIDGGIAGFLGSVIGLERDRAGKNAGPRTMALVGATAAMISSAGAVLNEIAKTGDPTPHHPSHYDRNRVSWSRTDFSIKKNRNSGSHYRRYSIRNRRHGLCSGTWISSRLDRLYRHRLNHLALYAIY